MIIKKHLIKFDTFMIKKKHNKLEIEKPTADFLLNGERLETFCPRSGMKQRYLLSILLNIVLRQSTRKTGWGRGRRKKSPDQKGKIKIMSICRQYDLVYRKPQGIPPPTHTHKPIRPNGDQRGFPGGSDGKESACIAGDLGSIPGLGGYPGGGNGYPLQYSGLENSMDCIVHGVTKSWTRLSDIHFHFHLGSEQATPKYATMAY